MRVLMELKRFSAHSADALYDGIRSIDWAEHLSADSTFAVRATVDT